VLVFGRPWHLGPPFWNPYGWARPLRSPTLSGAAPFDDAVGYSTSCFLLLPVSKILVVTHEIAGGSIPHVEFILTISRPRARFPCFSPVRLMARHRGSKCPSWRTAVAQSCRRPLKAIGS
jgi:hypothetical protein